MSIVILNINNTSSNPVFSGIYNNNITYVRHLTYTHGPRTLERVQLIFHCSSWANILIGKMRPSDHDADKKESTTIIKYKTK